jgi:hypothetical protein
MSLQELWAYSGEQRNAAEKAKSNPRRRMKTSGRRVAASARYHRLRAGIDTKVQRAGSFTLFIFRAETGLILLQQRATSFDFADDQLTRVLAIAGWMCGRRNHHTLVDQFLGPFRAYRLYAGNCVLVATGCGRGWGDSEGTRHLIEIGSDLVPTGGLRIEL